MDILNIQTFKGRNIYSHRPVIKYVVDLGDLYDTPTKDIDRFNERLLSMLPGLGRHFCSLGHEGGFAERLKEGTYLAHVTEHVILELQCRMGYDVKYGKTRKLEEPSVYYSVFEYKNEKFAAECLFTAVDMVNTLIGGDIPDIGAILRHLGETSAETDLGPSTKALYEEAVKRNIPVVRLDHSSILQLGTGRYARLMEASLTDRPGCIAVDTAGNKHLTKEILSEAGMPVPCGDIAYTPRSALMTVSKIKYPVVVKPFNGNQGKGVFIDINGEEELLSAFNTAITYSNAVIVEKYIPGKDYRLLVVGGKMAAAAERTPPRVTGDGIHTIRQLADMENKNPLRGADHEKALTRIKLDEMSKRVLAKAGYSESSVPAPGISVLLRSNGNISTGGTARDCTEEVHPENAALAVRAAELLGLDIAGIDMTCKDIAEPLTPDNGAIIEVNAAPGLRMHLCPSEGKPRNVAGDILDYLYPGGARASIPIVSITGTNGKTTVTRMIANTLAMSGKKIGMTDTSGVYIDGRCVLKGDNTGALSAAMVLRNRSIDAAVLETARGGIVRRGLGYDLADVGVIVNISGDHLGLNGINTLEELADVKSLVAEAVKPDGFAVLNAEDKMTPFIMERLRGKMLLFSADYRDSLLSRHIQNGGRAVYLRDGSIYSFDGSGETWIVKAAEVPITFGGHAKCNIENSLAAASALAALGIPADTVRKGLMGFKPDLYTNPGRFNIFDMGKFSVMLDYGHNPAGYRAVIDMVRSQNALRYTGVIGMPGDRRDESIEEAGRLCGRFFSKLYIKEDNDLRGRKAGEVADLLYGAAIKEGIDKKNITVVYSEEKALETAIEEAQPGDFIVMFYEELESALEVIEKYRRKLENKDKKAASAELRESEAG